MAKFWIALVVISSIATVWFSAIAAKGLWDYSQLDEITRAEVLEWKVSQKNSSEFAIEAIYSFTPSAIQYQGKTVFSKPYFVNEYSAVRAIEDLKGKTWTAWYHHSNPSICSLQKNFPFQSCIQAFLTLIVTLYFILLRGFLLRLSF